MLRFSLCCLSDQYDANELKESLAKLTQELFDGTRKGTVSTEHREHIDHDDGIVRLIRILHCIHLLGFIIPIMYRKVNKCFDMRNNTDRHPHRVRGGNKECLEGNA